MVSLTLGKSNQLSTLFVMRAAAVLPAYIVYPTYSAGLIILVNYLAFRELLTRRQYLATAMIGLGLILINLF